MRVKVSKSNG